MLRTAPVLYKNDEEQLSPGKIPLKGIVDEMSVNIDDTLKALVNTVVPSGDAICLTKSKEISNAPAAIIGAQIMGSLAAINADNWEIGVVTTPKSYNLGGYSPGAILTINGAWKGVPNTSALFSSFVLDGAARDGLFIGGFYFKGLQMWMPSADSGWWFDIVAVNNTGGNVNPNASWDFTLGSWIKAYNTYALL